MAYRLEKAFTFEAAHRLPKHDGKCARLHGHSYRCILILEGAALVESGPKTGMVVDYLDVSRAMQDLLDQHLDHHFLNETLTMEDTTVENVARWIFDYLKGLVPCLAAVRLHETPTASAEYRP